MSADGAAGAGDNAGFILRRRDMHAYDGIDEFQVFRDDEPRGRLVRPPRGGALLLGQYRKLDQGDVGKLMGELGDRARHVIGRGDNEQGAEAAPLRPTPRLDRIADGVDGLMIEIDAASEQPLILRSKPRKLARM